MIEVLNNAANPARFASLTALMLLLPTDASAAIQNDELDAFRAAAMPASKTAEIIHDEMIDDMPTEQESTEELSVSVAEELDDFHNTVDDDIEQEVDNISQADKDKLNTRLLRIVHDNIVGAGQDG